MPARVVEATVYRRHCFAERYSEDETGLLAEVDEAHEIHSASLPGSRFAKAGQTTICER